MEPTAGRVLDVVEAAYRLEGRDEEWLHGVTASFEAALGDGSGTIGLLPRATDAPSRFEHAVGVRIGDWWREQVATFETIPRPIYDTFSHAGPLLYWSQIYGDVTRDERATEFFEERARSLHGTTDDEVIELARSGRAAPRALPAERLALACYDSSGLGVGIIVALRTLVTAPPSAEAALIWGRVGAHVAAARRLRLAKADDAEAVLDAGGRIQHATGLAKESAARDALREAAVARDKARVRRRGDASADAATSQWRALVAGRWSLVDSFERDGRRYVLARPNSPSAAPTAPLSVRESQVVACAKLGHANKIIAYELGLSESTVAGHLARAARKLGAASRSDLIRIARESALPTTNSPSK